MVMGAKGLVASGRSLRRLASSLEQRDCHSNALTRACGEIHSHTELDIAVHLQNNCSSSAHSTSLQFPKIIKYKQTLHHNTDRQGKLRWPNPEAAAHRLVGGGKGTRVSDVMLASR
jgi:hypothetical protein